MINCQYSYSFWLENLQQARSLLAMPVCISSEYYLVMLLEQSIHGNVLANDNQLIQFVNHEVSNYQDLADQCLLISGMFPERSIALGAGSVVPIWWVGECSYNKVAGRNELFKLLAENFQDYVDLLLCMRYLITNEPGSINLLKNLASTGSRYPNFIAN